ncbi:NAD(P)H-dependent oxidoreductase [Intestinibacter sp.]
MEKLEDADAIIFGSPIYYRTITGQLHVFYEHLLFPYMTYKIGYPTLVENKMKTTSIYTMNVTEEDMVMDNYRQYMNLFEMFLEKYFSKPELLFSFNTYQKVGTILFNILKGIFSNSFDTIFKLSRISKFCGQ